MQPRSSSGHPISGALLPSESAPRGVDALVPPAIATRFKHHTPHNMAQSGSLTTCAANLRSLKTSSRQIYRTLRDIRASMSRLDVAGRNIFEGDWVAFVEQYKNLLDDTDVAASQLMAVIRVYLVLQSSKSEAQEADMVTELGNLRKSLTERTYDLSSRCKDLRGDIQASYERLSQAVETNGITAADPSDNLENSRETQTRRLGSDKASGTPARKPSILGRLMSAFLCRFLRKPRTSERQTAKLSRGLTNPERTPKDASQTGDETRIAPSTSDQRRPPARQDSQADAIPTTLEAIRESILGLETQAPLFDAFSELARHLRNELDAYLHAFEAAKALPANRKKALDEAQSRVVVSSKHWKECLAALNGDGSAAD
ncbi:hypothetical protein ONZ51_g11284 [Trametes cubensis]|uniref:Uncharacterized protein n=1 Tax=Trametes cubensis TaxID=1111947 RepID=A0AAD7TKF5_9APHY|nr:hypothetical protein ONZ51_g11284 [Trametes cubensis]